MFLQIFNIIFPVIAIALIGFFYARGAENFDGDTEQNEP